MQEIVETSSEDTKWFQIQTRINLEQLDKLRLKQTPEQTGIKSSELEAYRNKTHLELSKVHS